MKKLLFIILLLPSLVSAYTLEVVRGITVYTINGKPVDSQYTDSFPLLAGKNQLTVRFDGKLRDQGKSSHFQSKPYLVTVDVQSDIKLTPVSSKYKSFVALEKQQQALFKTANNTPEQQVLPAISNTLPYADIAALVTHYNDSNGIYFADSGLETLSASALTKQQQAQTSKVLAQLKYWYSQASAEEISAFEQWKAN